VKEGFWSWSLRVYARPAVQAACLDLQDAHGQSVPYLLWAAWMAFVGRPADTALLDVGAETARVWEDEVVGPLRKIRRRLKDAGVDALRQSVKATELESERVLMGRLEALASSPEGPSDVDAAVVMAGRVWDPGADLAALKHLASLLG
jgi:uncharacterized protein (TIGR02444 family)